MSRRIEIDRDICIGSGLCAATAPRHFALGEDRRSRILPDAGEPDEEVADAVDFCPVEAISLLSEP
ncbi:ferredoxin [Streptomyces sp. NBC_00690]|uniref:ferredoxin n=1 Tax=Streptomyces sp. NBC_00690 TaxID=2975808 RepID=UPI002E285209|nr:ferredoxin [Streptomyces sp. NBC_00690]